MKDTDYIERIENIACEYWKFQDIEEKEYKEVLQRIITDIRADTQSHVNAVQHGRIVS